jgi:hypothetical protein
MAGSWWAGVRRYATARDPMGDVVNTIALVIAGNQPLYPLYLFAIAGRAGWPALLTWCSTPLFLAVPALGRRSPKAGAMLLCTAGIGNTLLSNLVLGGISGIPLFYIPCIILCLTVLDPGAPMLRAVFAVAAGIPAVALARTKPWLTSFTPPQLRSLQHVHAFSVVCLTAFLVYLLLHAARRLRAAPSPSPSP